MADSIAYMGSHKGRDVEINWYAIIRCVCVAIKYREAILNSIIAFMGGCQVQCIRMNLEGDNHLEIQCEGKFCCGAGIYNARMPVEFHDGG